jgi:hypothetical protein
MVNLVKYAAIAAFATGLGVATTKPASAWWGSGPPSDPNYGYGWGAFASGYPEVYALTYPNGYGHVMTYPGGYDGYYRPYGPPYRGPQGQDGSRAMLSGAAISQTVPRHRARR